jgi:hypothetical protein
MIQNASVTLVSPVTFYNLYNITDEDLKKLRTMLDDGYVQETLDIFTGDYITAPTTKYQETMSRYLDGSDDGLMPDKEKNNLVRNITLLTIGLTSLLISNFNKFIKEVYSPSVFKDSGMTNPDGKKSILDEVLSNFEQTVSGSMAQTQFFITGSIRKLQREIVSENMKLKVADISGEVLNAEMNAFKKSLMNKYPEIYKAIKDGNLLTIKKFGGDGTESVVHFKPDYYLEMITRDLVLNVDRLSTETQAIVAGERVVEFYQSDPRNVKKDREICQSILANKVLGLSILAVDSETARLLGCMSIDEAKNTPDFSFANNCRHSVRRCSQEYLNEINKSLEG